MDTFWEIVASNAGLVVVLAIGVAILGRVWKNPAGLHILWVLVLLKLFIPPLITIGVPFPVDAPGSRTQQQTDNGEANWVAVATHAEMPTGMDQNARQSSLASTDDRASNGTAPDERRSLSWLTVFAWTWGMGTVVLASGQMYRVVRFRKVLRAARPAPAPVGEMADQIGRQLGLRRIPKILIVPIRVSPMVWSVGGRAQVILPNDLWERLESGGRETILAHEMAHVRRRDHLVRLLELISTALFWWHPVVWWASRELRELEERCCDAMVLDTAPDVARSYAIGLLSTLDFLSESSTALPLGATAAKPAVSLARRIEMLKNHRRSVARLTFGRVLLLATAAAIPMSLALAAESPRTERSLRPSSRESGEQRGTRAERRPAPVRRDRQAAQRKTVVYRLRNVPTIDVAQAVNDLLRGEKQMPMSPTELRAVVVPEPLSNSLLVTAAPDDLERIKQLVQDLDVSPKMVVIKMVIVQAVPAASESEQMSPAGGAPVRRKRVVKLKTIDGLATKASIEERLEELEKTRKLTILSRPQIVTLDTQPALVQVSGCEVFADDAEQRSDGRSKQKDQEVGLEVGITPRVASEGQVLMEIDLQVRQLRPVGAGVTAMASPAEGVRTPAETNGNKRTVRARRIVTTTAQSCLSVTAGRTLVLGGLMSDPEAPEEELLLILTPRIIDPEAEPTTE